MKLVIILVLVLAAIGYMRITEGFATKKDRSRAIYDWFRGGGSSYTSFRRDIDGGNIVEYEDALKLKQAGKLTADELEKLL